MARLAIKHVTVDNWLEPDPAATNLVTPLPEGGYRPTTNEEWLELTTRASLIDVVPDEVQDLFEVARGALAYGYLFYPLYTLVFEQLFRVAEAAVFHRCRVLDYQERQKPGKRRDPLNMKLDWLMQQGVLSRDQRQQWDALRELRNFSSHVTEQMIVSPNWAVAQLQMTADVINDLFVSVPPTEPSAQP